MVRPARLLVLMGVSGSGKSTVGEALAPRLGGIYLDGDAFHPPENVAKMSRGEPLTDADRRPWLLRVGQAMAAEPGIVIGGCSALKRAYRDALRKAAGEPLVFIELKGSRELLAERMRRRQGHFMPAALLASQLATLEPPGPDENAVTVGISGTTNEIVEAILAALKIETGPHGDRHLG